jgi:hypothetical protein
MMKERVARAEGEFQCAAKRASSAKRGSDGLASPVGGRERNRLAHQHAARHETIAVYSTSLPSHQPAHTSHPTWRTDSPR